MRVRLRFAAKNAHTSRGSSSRGAVSPGSDCPAINITPAAVMNKTKQVFAIVCDVAHSCLARDMAGESISGVASTVELSTWKIGLDAACTRWANQPSTALRALQATSMNAQPSSDGG